MVEVQRKLRAVALGALLLGATCAVILSHFHDDRAVELETTSRSSAAELQKALSAFKANLAQARGGKHAAVLSQLEAFVDTAPLLSNTTMTTNHDLEEELDCEETRQYMELEAKLRALLNTLDQSAGQKNAGPGKGTEKVSVAVSAWETANNVLEKSVERSRVVHQEEVKAHQSALKYTAQVKTLGEELSKAKKEAVAADAHISVPAIAKARKGIAHLQAAINTGNEDEYRSKLPAVLADIDALPASPARIAALRSEASALVDPVAKTRDLLARTEEEARARMVAANGRREHALAQQLHSATLLRDGLERDAEALSADFRLQHDVERKAKPEVAELQREAADAETEAAAAARESAQGGEHALEGGKEGGRTGLVDAAERVVLALKHVTADCRLEGKFSERRERKEGEEGEEGGGAGLLPALRPLVPLRALTEEASDGVRGKAKATEGGLRKQALLLAGEGLPAGGKEVVEGIEGGNYPALHPRANETLSDSEMAAYEAAVAEAETEASAGGALPRHNTYINVWPAKQMHKPATRH